MTITKITSTEFNQLKIPYEVEHIIINKLKYDDELNIPIWIKKFHIKTIKEDNEKLRKEMRIIQQEYIKKYKDPKEHFEEAIIMPMYIASYLIFDALTKLIKLPFNTKLLVGGNTPDNEIFYYYDDDNRTNENEIRNKHLI